MNNLRNVIKQLSTPVKQTKERYKNHLADHQKLIHHSLNLCHLTSLDLYSRTQERILLVSVSTLLELASWVSHQQVTAQENVNIYKCSRHYSQHEHNRYSAIDNYDNQNNWFKQEQWY